MSYVESDIIYESECGKYFVLRERNGEFSLNQNVGNYSIEVGRWSKLDSKSVFEKAKSLIPKLKRYEKSN